MVGIDPDRDRLELARKIYSAPNLEYLEGRGEDIPGGGYDMIYSNYVLHWCPDRELIFKQIHKCLKTGGKFGFVATSYFKANPTIFTSDMVSPEFDKAVAEMFRPPPVEEYKHLIATNNFKTVHFEEKARDWNFGNVDALIEMLRYHTLGKFDETHFNVDVMKHRFGEGDITLKAPYCVAVVHKE